MVGTTATKPKVVKEPGTRIRRDWVEEEDEDVFVIDDIEIPQSTSVVTPTVKRSAPTTKKRKQDVVNLDNASSAVPQKNPATKGTTKKKRNEKQQEETKVVCTSNHDKTMNNSIFFIRMKKLTSFVALLKQCKNVSADVNEAIIIFNVDSNGFNVLRDDSTSERWFSVHLDPSSFDMFYFDAKRTGYKFHLNVQEVLGILKMNGTNTALSMYVKYVLSDPNADGQRRLIPDSGVSLFFETTNGGQARSKVGIINVLAEERYLDNDTWGAIFKPLTTEFCTRSSVYQKSYSETVLVGVSKLNNSSNALEFFMEVVSQRGCSKDKWNLRSDKGQVKDIQLYSESEVHIDIKTESINMIHKLLPFWENVTVCMEHMGLMKIDMNFDNEMGKGSICYAIASQEAPCS